MFPPPPVAPNAVYLALNHGSTELRSRHQNCLFFVARCGIHAMPYTVRSFQPTPNPNALKCVLDRPITRGPVSFRSSADVPAPGDGASRDAAVSEAYRLAPALFAVPGVAGLLFNQDWVTVNKAPQSDWAEVKAGVTRVLRGEG